MDEMERISEDFNPSQQDLHNARIEERKLYKQYRRDEAEKDNIHKIFKIFLWILAIGLGAIFMVRIVHFVIPPYLQWLAPEQLQEIDKLLFTGFAGTFVGRYVNKLYNW